MIDWVSTLNLSISISGSTIAFLGFLLNWFIRRGSKKSKNFFTIFFVILMAYTAVLMINLVSFMYLDSGYMWLSRITMYLHSLLSSLLLPMMAYYVISQSNRNWKKSKIFRAVSVLWFIYFLLLSSTWFTDWIYYFTPDNGYFRGDLYFLLLTPPAVSIGLLLIDVIVNSSHFSKRQYHALLLYLLTPLICTSIQMFSSGLLFTAIGISVSSVLIFVNSLIDRAEKSLEMAEENAAQRISIMQLQMRPHFVFNTLMSIYYLCEQDPEKAQNVILNFSNYLRQNYSALTNEDTITFTEELEHTKAYLAVEQVRFEGRINIEYDTPHTDFRLPPLTLQPLVENAIKHGRGPGNDTLNISITTAKTGDKSVLTVANTGVEFGAIDSNGTHIAMDNIRERLRLLCDGTLTVMPRDGGGTTVTVSIPAE